MKKIQEGYEFFINTSKNPFEFKQQVGDGSDDSEEITNLILNSDVDDAWDLCKQIYRRMEPERLENMAGNMFRIFVGRVRKEVKKDFYQIRLSTLEQAVEENLSGVETLKLIKSQLVFIDDQGKK